MFLRSDDGVFPVVSPLAVRGGGGCRIHNAAAPVLLIIFVTIGVNGRIMKAGSATAVLRRQIRSAEAEFPVVYSMESAGSGGGSSRSNAVAAEGKIHVEGVLPEVGQYVALIGVGGPEAAELPVIVDTGSELSWVRCSGAGAGTLPAGKKAPFVFNPSKSASFSSTCSRSSSSNGNSSDSCGASFSITYADGSGVGGSLAADTLSCQAARTVPNGGIHSGAGMTMEPSSSVCLRRFVFGCSHRDSGVESGIPAAGLLGLDRGPLSLISQFAADSFSYCLPASASSVGFLSIRRFRRRRFSHLRYTPLLRNQHSPFTSQFYYLNLTSIAVGLHVLAIPPHAFSVHPVSGGGGTIIDSGTAFTTLVDEAFVPFASAVNASIDPAVERLHLQGVNGSFLPIPCYRMREPPSVPEVLLQFEGGAEIRLGGGSLFFGVAAEGGGGGGGSPRYYCLAVASGGAASEGGRNFLGHFQQRDILVEYDIRRSKVGFALAPNCAVDYSSSPPRLVDFMTLTLTFTFATSVCSCLRFNILLYIDN